MHRFTRLEQLLGSEGLQKLQGAKVVVFGLGGVGSYAAEALARAGIGRLELVDADTVCLSNINRQLIALHSTIGQAKTEVMKGRIKDINPDCEVVTHQVYVSEENVEKYIDDKFSYAVDAIDTISSKLALSKLAVKKGIPIISAMGTGNLLDATKFRIADISETSYCPLARVMRRELRKHGIEKGIKVVYSTADRIKIQGNEGISSDTSYNSGLSALGSISFVPPVAGLLLASAVVNDILDNSID